MYAAPVGSREVYVWLSRQLFGWDVDRSGVILVSVGAGGPGTLTAIDCCFLRYGPSNGL